MSKVKYNVIKGDNVPVKMWTKDVHVESQAIDQLKNIASMPFIYKHVAAMPDVHLGRGATVGSVIATRKAIIPAAVGVDIGCGMSAMRLSLKAHELPDSLSRLRSKVEEAIPVGFAEHSASYGRYVTTKGQFKDVFMDLKSGFDHLADKHPDLMKMGKRLPDKIASQLGTLGGGNHFIELCIDESDDVWVMLHTGSRGIGNCIGRYFIEKAKEEMKRWHINIPDQDLAYFPEGNQHYYDYTEAVEWAQDYARKNRDVMMILVLEALRKELPEFTVTKEAINCHHNYVTMENHFGENVWVTRKGAVSAREGQLGIIPGSMGAKSFIVSGKGNADSFHSCSHGAGRMMSRSQAKKQFTVDDHEKATHGVECRKDNGVIDETPSAYKDIDKVMKAQEDLVDIVHTLKQVMCVKG